MLFRFFESSECLWSVVFLKFHKNLLKVSLRVDVLSWSRWRNRDQIYLCALKGKATDKDLWYSRGKYSPYLIITHDGKEFEKEYIYIYIWFIGGSGDKGKELICNAGDLDLISGLGTSPKEKNDNTLQYS